MYSCGEQAAKTVVFLVSVPKIEIKTNLTENDVIHMDKNDKTD